MGPALLLRVTPAPGGFGAGAVVVPVVDGVVSVVLGLVGVVAVPTGTPGSGMSLSGVPGGTSTVTGTTFPLGSLT
jgi:hypothetical protein